jgi:ubiquinone/menaquinone biosynthesis C-methylase UbiE
VSSINQAIEEQFGNAAAAYRTSAVHAAGQDLETIIRFVRQLSAPRVLDAGCGAGHVSVGVAPWSMEVVACDLTAAMLDQVRELAAERSVTNVETRQADVGRLPFPDADFDIVVSRYSAHHWTDVPAALREFGRVLKPGGQLVVGDIVAPPVPAFDTFLQTIEYLRDRSHVRDYGVAEWMAMFEGAGFASRVAGTWPVPLEFGSWVARIGTPAPLVATLQHLFATAAAETRAHFAVQPDASFTIQCAVMHAVKR